MMPYKSSLSPEAIANMFDGFATAKSHKQVISNLSDNFGFVLKVRQVSNWKKKWRGNTELQAKMALVDWDNVQELLKAGVLLEHLPLLRKISYWATETFGPSGLFDPTPNYTALRWQSYILSYSPTVEKPLDIWVIGELYTMRDICAQITKNPIEKHDLDGWITFTPWRDSTNIFEPDPPNPLTRYKKEYLKSIGKGHIPPLKHELNLNTNNTTRGAIALFLANIDNDITLLPSQQCKDKLSLPLPFNNGKKNIQIDLSCQ